MVSNIDTAKGAHVTLIKALAVIYGLAVGFRSPWSHLVLGFEMTGGLDTERQLTFSWLRNSASPFRKFIGFLKLGLFPPSPLESCQNKC